MGMEEPPETGDYFVDLRPFLRDRLGIRDPELVKQVESQMRAALRRPWTAKDFPQLADWMVANAKPLDLIVKAANRPHYYCPRLPGPDNTIPGLSGVLFSGMTLQRSLATALSVRATFRLATGKPDEAMGDVLAARRLARHFARGGFTIDTIVGLACDGIATLAATAVLDRPDVTAEQLVRYLADLRALPPMPNVADALDSGERLLFLDTLTGPLKAGPAGTAGDVDLDAALRRSNLIYDRTAEALRKPDRAKREAALDRLEAELKERPKGNSALKAGEPPAQASGRGLAEVMTGMSIEAARACNSRWTDPSNPAATCRSPLPWRSTSASAAATRRPWPTWPQSTSARCRMTSSQVSH
jgi:hypothetical protein